MKLAKSYLNKALERIAPFSLAEEWDNVGLLIESSSEGLFSVMVALEPSILVIEEAIRKKVDCLITHHPLFFKLPKVLQYSKDKRVEKITLLIKNNIHYYALHTNFDSAIGGANDILADIIGLQNRVAIKKCEQAVCENKTRGTEPGIGRIGTLQRPMNLGELGTFFGESLSTSGIRFVGNQEQKFKKVAICSGSGGDMWKASMKMGAEVLITGDIKYHQAEEATEQGLSLIDFGHFPSERFAMKHFTEKLRSELASCEVSILFSEEEKDPFLGKKT